MLVDNNNNQKRSSTTVYVNLLSPLTLDQMYQIHNDFLFRFLNSINTYSERTKDQMSMTYNRVNFVFVFLMANHQNGASFQYIIIAMFWLCVCIFCKFKQKNSNWLWQIALNFFCQPRAISEQATELFFNIIWSSWGENKSVLNQNTPNNILSMANSSVKWSN